ncbi:MAG: IS982 family transposase [Chloroflexota bacterium]|nr:IS982 family transposase [Chloroflexota bacterium]
MIAEFDDFCLWMYVVIDEIWKGLPPLVRRPGPAPSCSDSELISMAIVGQCRGWTLETDLISYWHERRDLFQTVSERSSFNRRRRNLMQAINCFRLVVLRLLDFAQDHSCTIDSLPVPVVQFHLVPGASREGAALGAPFGKVATKKQTIFGYKLHLLVTLIGGIVDVVLAPAHAMDVTIGEELLREHTDSMVIGYKGYIGAALSASLADSNRLQLLTSPRPNPKQQLPREVAALLNARRQIIETVHGQLTDNFGIETNHAHTFWGLCARLYTKLEAHTLSVPPARVDWWLVQVREQRGHPETIVIDSGPIFASQALDAYAFQHDILLQFIRTAVHLASLIDDR